MRPIDIPQIAELSKPEKILFVEELWDEISVEDDDIPIPESHKQELDRRYMNYQKMPGNLLTLQELQTRIEKRK
jgi:putative addiction module component (TIGR02574 family)